MAPKPVDVEIRGKNKTKGAFAEATRDVEEFGKKVEALNKPFEALENVVAGVGAFVVVEFFRKTVEAAAEAEAAWARIGAAVSNAGIHLSGVHSELEGLFTAMTKTSRFSERELANAFGTLMTVTHDYSASVKNLQLVADVATAKQIDLGEAATMVGRVIEGTGTRALKQWGISADNATEALEKLRDASRGYAEKDAETLGGALHKIANQFEKIAEAIGKAITGNGGAGGGLNAFADRLGRLAEFIEGHHASFDRLERLFSLMGAIQTRGLEQLSPFGRVMSRITGDTPGAEPSVDFGAAMMSGGQSLLADREIAANARRAAAEREAAALKKEVDELHKKIAETEGGVLEDPAVRLAIERMKKQGFDPTSGSGELGVRNTLRDMRDKAALNRASMAFLNAGGPHAADLTTTVEGSRNPAMTRGEEDMFGGLSRELPKALDTAQGAVTNFFGAWNGMIDALIQHHGSLGKAIVDTGRHAIGQVMAAQGQAALLKAGEAAAEGLWPPNPALLAKAARLLAIGTAESAFGSLLGGGGGGGFGGGGGGGLGAGGFQSQQSAMTRKATTVVFKGGSFINLADPSQRAELIANLRDLAGDGDLNFLFE